MLIYMTGCLQSLLVLRNIQLCDIHYLRFRTIYRTEKYSYPTLSSYDLKRALIGSLDFHSKLDFLIHPPQKLRFYSPSLYISRLLVDERADNFRYAALTISLERRSSSKIRRDRGSRYCGNKWDKDYNTMSLTYICQAVFCGLF